MAGKLNFLLSSCRKFCVMTDSTIGFTATGITLLVTVTLFCIEWIRRWVAGNRSARHALVARVIDALDKVVRSYVHAPFSQFWTSADAEYVLLIPRLLLELPSKDRAIAAWAARRIQVMQSQTSDKESLAVAANIAEELVKWDHRERKRDWFESELKADPYVANFKVPARARATRLTRSGWSWFQISAMGAVVVLVGRAALK